METTAVLSIMAATAVNSAMPGPCMILIAARTAQSGPRSGFRASLGIATAQMIYATTAFVMLSLALNISETVHTTLRYAGAGVLLLLATKMLMDSGPAPVARGMSISLPGNDVLVGLGIGLSSPFNLVFMFSILPQFVSRGALNDPSIPLLFSGIFLATMGPMIATIWIANGARAVGRNYVPLLVRTSAALLILFAVTSIMSVA